MATLNQITVVSGICNTNVTIPQPVTTIVQVATPGPQGSQGPQGPQGVTGVSSQIATGSVTASVNIGTDTFKIESGSSTYLYISSSGNIGVGTATPTLGLLQLNSAAGITNPSLYINAANVGTTASITVRANNGVNTPSQKIYNPVGGSDSLNFIQLLDADTTTTTSQPIGRIIFSSNDSDSGGTKAFIEAVSEDATPDAFLAFGTNQSGSSVTERMRITSTGNVGVGTVSPSTRLHISGASDSGLFKIDSPAVNNIVYISGSGNVGIGTSTPLSSLTVAGGNINIETGYAIGGNSLGTFSPFIRYSNTGVGVPSSSFGHTTAYMLSDAGGVFGTNDLSFWAGGFVQTEIMRIVGSTGFVGIGESSPSAKLEIKGSGVTSATTALRVKNSNASASLVVRNDGNVGIGTSTPSSQLHISGASAIMTLSPIDPLPTSNVPSASFATSGSGANLKPYFWNGSSWTAFALL
jgi:hypothetical protein